MQHHDDSPIFNASTNIFDTHESDKFSYKATEKSIDDSVLENKAIQQDSMSSTKNSVQFTHVQVYEFEREAGVMCVPSQGGAALGMSSTHLHNRSFPIDEYDKKRILKRVKRIHELYDSGKIKLSSRQQAKLFQHLRNELTAEEFNTLPRTKNNSAVKYEHNAHHADRQNSYPLGQNFFYCWGQADISDFYQNPCRDQNKKEEIVVSDDDIQLLLDECYAIQVVPIKRRKMLLKEAGVVVVDSSDRAEYHKIRQSRLSCGCDCENGICNPSTCSCAIEGISCQMDRLQFPCVCCQVTCGNTFGRVEFKPMRVRTHFIHTKMRLALEEANSSPLPCQPKSSGTNATATDTTGGLSLAILSATEKGDDKLSTVSSGPSKRDVANDKQFGRLRTGQGALSATELAQYNSTENGSCRDCQNSNYVRALVNEMWHNQKEKQLREENNCALMEMLSNLKSQYHHYHPNPSHHHHNNNNHHHHQASQHLHHTQQHQLSPYSGPSSTASVHSISPLSFLSNSYYYPNTLPSTSASPSSCPDDMSCLVALACPPVAGPSAPATFLERTPSEVILMPGAPSLDTNDSYVDNSTVSFVSSMTDHNNFGYMECLQEPITAVDGKGYRHCPSMDLQSMQLSSFEHPHHIVHGMEDCSAAMAEPDAGLIVTSLTTATSSGSGNLEQGACDMRSSIVQCKNSFLTANILSNDDNGLCCGSESVTYTQSAASEGSASVTEENCFEMGAAVTQNFLPTFVQRSIYSSKQSSALQYNLRPSRQHIINYHESPPDDLCDRMLRRKRKRRNNNMTTTKKKVGSVEPLDSKVNANKGDDVSTSEAIDLTVTKLENFDDTLQPLTTNSIVEPSSSPPTNCEASCKNERNFFSDFSMKAIFSEFPTSPKALELHGEGTYQEFSTCDLPHQDFATPTCSGRTTPSWCESVTA